MLIVAELTRWIGQKWCVLQLKCCTWDSLLLLMGGMGSKCGTLEKNIALEGQLKGIGGYGRGEVSMEGLGDNNWKG